MEALVYFLVIPFIYLISLLPFPLLYGFSNFVYFIFYRVVGYRKDVVLQNLRNSFPEKNEAEINKICSDYYHYLCDLFLETFKTLTISEKEMLKRCKFSPDALKLFNKYAAENQSVILVMGHFGNWEWAGNTFSLVGKHQLYVIYHPLRNKRFDQLMYRMRSRFGSRLIPMKETYKEMLSNRGGLNATAFISDQTPQPNNAYWTTFLNQDTPVFKGVEIISRKLNFPVIYARIARIKRGFYEIQAELLVEKPAETIDDQLSEMHTRTLEADIIKQPEIWLWSHRRWKHKRPAHQ